MDAVQAIVLGIVQGLTEFLPVSSTAHLRIVPAFFGWDDPGAAFTAVVQLGTMAAVLVYFRRELWAIAAAWVRSVLARERAPQDPDARMGWYIILGTIPIAILGLAFKDQIENEFRTLELVGSALILFSFVMLRAEAVSRRDRDLGQFTRRDGIIIGCAQALALVPGVSRSGATISAGLFLNFDRTTAARPPARPRWPPCWPSSSAICRSRCSCATSYAIRSACSPRTASRSARSCSRSRPPTSSTDRSAVRLVR